MIYMIPNIAVGHIFGNSVILTVVQKTIKVGSTGENKSGYPSGRLPRCARNDIVLRTEGNEYRVFRNDETSVARIYIKKTTVETVVFCGTREKL